MHACSSCEYYVTVNNLGAWLHGKYKLCGRRVSIEYDSSYYTVHNYNITTVDLQCMHTVAVNYVTVNKQNYLTMHNHKDCIIL